MRFVSALLAGAAALLVGLALLPIPDGPRLRAAERQDQRIRLVLDRIRINPTPIDIAFIGTSHTVSAIDDARLETALAAGHVANLGTNWMGRDMHLFLLRELLTHKAPRLVVIEVNEREHPFGHVVLPFAGGLGEVLCCHAYLDPTLPRRLAAFLRQQALHAVAGAFPAEPSGPAFREDHTWMPLEGTRSNPELDLNTSRHWLRTLPVTQLYGLKTVERMAAMAKAGGVRLVFLYQPNYVHVAAPPHGTRAAYTALGSVLELPAELGSDPALWYDDGHLNRNGVRVLSPALAEGLRPLVPR